MGMRPGLVAGAFVLVLVGCSSSPPSGDPNQLSQDYAASFTGEWAGNATFKVVVNGQGQTNSGTADQKVTATGVNRLQLPGFCTGQDVGPTAAVTSATTFAVDPYSCSYTGEVSGCIQDLTVSSGSGTLRGQELDFFFQGTLHEHGLPSNCPDLEATFTLSFNTLRAVDVVAPTDLVATAGSYYGSVLLTWTPVSGASGYATQYRIGSGAYQDVTPQTLYNGSASLYLSSVPEASTVTFRIYAYSNGNHHSGPSNEASLQFPLNTPTAFYSNLVAAGVQLTWSFSSAATALTLERTLLDTGGNPVGWSVITGVPFSTTGYLDTDVAEGAYYRYRLTVSAGSISSGSVETQTYGAIPMLAPTDLVATGLVEGVQLSWVNHSQAATEVVVFRSPGINSYPYLEVAHLPADATSYMDLELATGYYTYRLEARGPGASAASNSTSVVTLPLPGGVTLTTTVVQLNLDPYIRRDGQGNWFTGGGSALWDQIHVLTPNGTGWDAQFFPAAERWYAPYFLLDHQQQPHLLWLRTVVQGTNNTAVVHSWRDGSGWHEEEVVRRALDASHGFTFTLDASDALHVLLLKDGSGVASTGNLEYAHHTASGWVTEPVAGFTPALTDVQSLSLAVDGTGAAHLAVGELAHLWHAERSVAGTWAVEEAPTGGSSETGFLDLRALTSGDLLAFYETTHAGDPAQIDLVCLQRVSGAWGLPVVIATRAPDGATAAVAVAPSDQRFAAALRTNAGQKLYVGDGTTWTETLVGPPVDVSALGFDATGKLWLLARQGWSDSAVLYAEP